MKSLPIVLILTALILSFVAGLLGRGTQARLERAQAEKVLQQAYAAAEARVKAAEARVGERVVIVNDISEAERERIHEEYEERVRAIRAGHAGDVGRMRSQWAACETGRLADGAAVAGAAAEEDRLRREGLQRVLRDVRLLQSERDEAVDRYEAVRVAFADGGTTE